MNYEDFVTYTQAVKLKELGFDEQCFAYYLYDDKLEIGRQLQRYNSECHLINLGYIAAPTLAQAQKWLRETKGMCVMVIKCTNIISCVAGKYYSEMREMGGKIIQSSQEIKETYEEALSEGIDEMLELLKEKK